MELDGQKTKDSETPLELIVSEWKAYKATGRTPEEIVALAEERDAAVETISFFGTCAECSHEPECDEIGGRCEGRGFGTYCQEPYDKPHFKWKGPRFGSKNSN